jgi:hypothetical protein
MESGLQLQLCKHIPVIFTFLTYQVLADKPEILYHPPSHLIMLRRWQLEEHSIEKLFLAKHEEHCEWLIWLGMANHLISFCSLSPESHGQYGEAVLDRMKGEADNEFIACLPESTPPVGGAAPHLFTLPIISISLHTQQPVPAPRQESDGRKEMNISCRMDPSQTPAGRAVESSAGQSKEGPIAGDRQGPRPGPAHGAEAETPAWWGWGASQRRRQSPRWQGD